VDEAEKLIYHYLYTFKNNPLKTRYMRKIIFILAAIAIIFSACNNGKQYTIRGKAEGIKSGKATLQVYENGKWTITDSADIKDGKFVFKGSLKFAEMRFLFIDSINDRMPLFVENSRICLKIFKDSIDKSLVNGSKSHDIFMEYQKLTKESDAKQDVAYQGYKEAKKARNLSDIKKYDSIATLHEKEKGLVMKDIVVKNPKSVVGPYLIVANSWQFELADLESVAATVDTSINNSTYVLKIRERIEILKKVAVGQMAPDFSMADSTGKVVSLSSFKGKLVLIDFWASWCSPCRAENPGIVKVYNEFHSKGFYILGVSLDKKRESWLKAVADDQLSWEQVSELKGWDCSAGKLYGVNSIPANILVDADGKIIARNIFGDELKKKLAEVLK
jgi:peroxiredoxin